MTENTVSHQARFQHFIVRSLVVTRQRIEKECKPNPLADSDRNRALNVLSYALKLDAAWRETYQLCLALAAPMEMTGYRSEWMLFLTQALQVAKTQQDCVAEAELALASGQLYRLQGQFAQAQPLLLASAGSFALRSECRGQARAWNQLAYVAWQQHRYDEAVTWAQSAIERLGEADAELATSFSALGLVAFNQGELPEAEKYHRMALSIRHANHDRRRTAWSLQNLGDVLRSQGDYRTAITCFEEAITSLISVGDQAHLAIVQMNLGIVYYLYNDFSKSLGFYAMAEEIFRHVADQFNLAKILTNQGLCYLSLQKWEIAAQLFITSSELFQALGDLSWFLNALDGAGIAYLEEGSYPKALAIFERVANRLPEIIATPAYRMLSPKIVEQLARARKGVKEAVA